MENLLQVLALDLLQPLKHTGGQHFLILGSPSEGRKATLISFKTQLYIVTYPLQL